MRLRRFFIHNRAVLFKGRDFPLQDLAAEVVIFVPLPFRYFLHER